MGDSLLLGILWLLYLPFNNIFCEGALTPNYGSHALFGKRPHVFRLG